MTGRKSRLRCNLVADRCRDVGTGQQAPEQRDRLRVPTDPACANRLFIGCAPVVDLCDLSGENSGPLRGPGFRRRARQTGNLPGSAAVGGTEGRWHTAARRGSVESPRPAGRRLQRRAMAHPVAYRLRDPPHRNEDLLVGCRPSPSAAHTTCARRRIRPHRSRSGPGIRPATHPRVAVDLGQQLIAFVLRLMPEQIAVAGAMICAVVLAFGAHIDARVVSRSGFAGDILEV